MTTKQEKAELENSPTQEVGKRNGGCIVEKMVGNCGPYLYHVQRVDGRQYWKYLGKVGSARAQTAQAAHARIYQPDDEEDEPLNRVGKISEVVER